jgi:hypothetical protein
VERWSVSYDIERILGDSDFVMEALKASEEELERKYGLKAEGYMITLNSAAGRNFLPKRELLPEILD